MPGEDVQAWALRGAKSLESSGAQRLARIAHDPQHVCEGQLAGCGCFLPHLLVGTAGRSLGAASARPLSTVSVHRAIAVDRTAGRAFRIRFTCTTTRYSINDSARHGADFRSSRGRAKENLLVFLPPRPFHKGGWRGRFTRLEYSLKRTCLFFLPPRPF